MTEDTKVIDQLNELLDIERAALLSGDLAGLENIAQEKEALLDALHEGVAAKDLQALQDRLDRNRHLLTSATEAIRRVADRLREMRKLRQSLDTYTSNGSRQTLDFDGNSKLEKRA